MSRGECKLTTEQRAKDWPRITLSLPPELILSLDGLAERRGLTRGAFTRMLLTDHVREQAAPDGQDD